MAKWAEKFIVLTESADVLLSQVYNMRRGLGDSGNDQSKPAALTNADLYGKLRKEFEKRFPELPPNADLEKIKGYEDMRLAARDTLASLEPYYETFVAAKEFKDEAFGFLKEVMQSHVVLDFSKNRQVVHSFFTLFMRYVQLNMLTSYIEPRRYLLAMYAKAMEFSGSASEDRFHGVAKYTSEFEQPIRKMQTEFRELSPNFGRTLLSLVPQINDMPLPHTPVLEGTANAEPREIGALRKAGVFALFRGDNVTGQVQEEVYDNLSQFPQLCEWVQWGFLICPWDLQVATDESLQVLNACLRDAIVVPLYREEWFDMHEAWQEQCKAFKVDKWRLGDYKKSFKESEVQAFAKAASVHKIRRVFLKIEMGQMASYFGDLPALLPPKIQLVLSALAMARDEVLWYLRHDGFISEVANVKKQRNHTTHMVRGHDMSDFTDDGISELVDLSDRLQHLTLANEDIIAEYYARHLSLRDATEFQRLMDDDHLLTDSGIKDILEANLRHLLDCSPEADLFPLRLNWFRAMAFASSLESKFVKPKDIAELSEYMVGVVARSQHVDLIQAQVAAVSLQGAFWFQRSYISLLRKSTQSSRRASHCVAFVRHIQSFVYNVAEYFPDERTAVGRESTALADRSLELIAKVVTELIRGIAKDCMQSLDRQVAPVRAVSAPKDRDPPGAESMPSYWLESQSLRSWQESLAGICGAMHSAGLIPIHDKVYAPREFLRERMAEAFRRYLWHLAMVEHSGEAMARPTDILSGMERYLRAARLVEEFAGLDVGEMLRAVLLGTAYKAGVSDIVEPRRDREQTMSHGLLKAAPHGQESLAASLALFYTNLLRSKASSGNIQYSDFHQGLVSGLLLEQPSAAFAKAQFRAEEYSDVSELRALCQLLGPYGIKVIDASIVQYICEEAQAIKEWLQENKTVLEEFEKDYVLESRADVCMGSKYGIVSAARLLEPSIRCGVAICFRAKLRQAMRETIEGCHPQLVQCVETCQRFAQGGLLQSATASTDPALEAAARIAFDVGADSSILDMALKDALAPLMDDAEAAKLWRLLGPAYACSLKHPLWKESQYMPNLGAFNNNLHCMGHTMLALTQACEWRAAERLSVASGGPPGPISWTPAVTDLLRDFVTMAVLSMMRLQSDQPRASASKRGAWRASGMHIWIDQFVTLVDPLVPRSLMEEIAPYDAIRSAYLSAHGHQHVQQQEQVLFEERVNVARGEDNVDEEQ